MTANSAPSDDLAPIELWRPAIEGHLRIIEHFARAAGLDSSEANQVLEVWRQAFLECPTWRSLHSTLLAFYEQVIDAQEIQLPSKLDTGERKIAALRDMVHTADLIRAWQALVNLVDFILEIDAAEG